MEDSSFVVVEPELDQATVLSSLNEFFPSLTTGDWSLWSVDRQLEVSQQRQRRPDGRLFVDELFSLVEMDGSAVYPPTSAASLHQLLFELLTGPSLHHGHCIIFYLLLAQSYPTGSSVQSDIPARFARKMLLPTGFLRGVEGFYSLDSDLWRPAVAALTDSHSTPDFVAKTLEVLSLLPPVPDRAGLVLSYWRLSGIDLPDKEQLGFVLDALCDKNRKRGVVQAWALVREWQNDDERAKLADRVLARCFGDNPTATPVPQHLQALLSQPFSQHEDKLVSTFCLAPPPSLRPASQILVVDWRISKFVAEDRPVEALRFAHQARAKGLPTTEDRVHLLRAVRDTLSELQKSEIDLEGDIPAPGPSNSAPAAVNGITASTSNIAHPAWQPQPARPVTPALRSLAEVARAKETVPAPQRVDLPLSASPFLRRDAPLVGTRDGGALGGAQKSVLRALREGTQDAAGSPKGKGRATPESPRSVFGADSPRRFVSIGSDVATSPRASTGGLDGKEAATPRKPTLSGFGSVRQPASASYRMPEPEDDEMSDQDETPHDQLASSPPPPPSARPLPARIASGTAAPQSPFAFRATQDPAIASTLAAATPAKPTRTPRAEAKRRPSASRDTHKAGVPEEKRRAMSVEAEDRPSARLPVAASGEAAAMAGGGMRRSKTMQSLPPGGFPGLDDDDVAEEEEEHAVVQQEEAPREKRTRAKAAAAAAASATPAKTPLRRSARASSVQAEDRERDAATATPRPRTRLAKSLSQQSLAPETPKTRMSTRKSSRLLNTPALLEREEQEEGRTPARGRSKKK